MWIINQWLQIPNQIALSPRNIEGFGLSDGEGTERLWSYLRRFSTMTKEMRPSHRIDVLTDAILFYAQKSSSNLGNMSICIAHAMLHEDAWNKF